MNETERKVYLEQFNRRTHVLGRAVCVITLVLLVGAPFLIGTFLGAMPDMGAVGKGFLSVGVVWAVASVAEFLIYTPMLGAGGGYLAFITGNLINMKIPCAVNARDIAGTKTGTAENEIISTLSIATSSLVTIVVLALGVALLVPLQPVLQSPVLQPAFANVVPALFGAMAYQYFRKNIRVAIAPLVMMSVLFMLVPSLTGSTSFMIVPSGALAIGIAYAHLPQAESGGRYQNEIPSRISRARTAGPAGSGGGARRAHAEEKHPPISRSRMQTAPWPTLKSSPP